MITNIIVAGIIAIVSLIIAQTAANRMLKKRAVSTIAFRGHKIVVPTKVAWAYWQIASQKPIDHISIIGGSDGSHADELIVYTHKKLHRIHKDGTVYTDELGLKHRSSDEEWVKIYV